MSDELTLWLTTQLDEDERIAQQTCEWPWTMHPEGDKILRHNDGSYDDWEDEQLIVVETHAWSSKAARDNAAHVIRWEPSRVVVDVAAKRALIGLHGFYLAGGQRERMCKTCGGEGVMSAISWPCNTLRLLATAYAHRGGFDPQWAVLNDEERW